MKDSGGFLPLFLILPKIALAVGGTIILYLLTKYGLRRVKLNAKDSRASGLNIRQRRRRAAEKSGKNLRKHF